MEFGFAPFNNLFSDVPPLCSVVRNPFSSAVSKLRSGFGVRWLAAALATQGPEASFRLAKREQAPALHISRYAVGFPILLALKVMQ